MAGDGDRRQDWKQDRRPSRHELTFDVRRASRPAASQTGYGAAFTGCADI